MKKVLIIILAVLSAILIPGTAALAAGENNNEMITYLSDMEWTGAEIYNGAVPSRDENVAGEELWLYDMYFDKGVCLHAMPGKNAYIEVDIEGKGFKTFCAYPGTAESEKFNVTMASVRFMFIVDGKTVKKTDVVTPKERPSLLTVDVSGCKKFRIEMDDGGDGISGDWGALGDALFSTSDSVEEITAALEARDAAKPAESWDDDPGQNLAIAEPNGGCGGFAGGAAALGITAGAALAMRKKKK